MTLLLDNLLIEAEQHFLSLCLFNPDVLNETSICTADLYSAQHRAIYSGMRKLWDVGTTPTMILLAEYLESQKTLESAGGREAIAQMLAGTELVPTPWKDLEALIKKKSASTEVAGSGAKNRSDRPRQYCYSSGSARKMPRFNTLSPV